MATRMPDGTFGPTQPFPEALETFLDLAGKGLAKSFHVGTPQQIEAQKEELQSAQNVADLAKRVAALEAEKNSLIVRPTFEDVEKFGVTK
jgi:hypothetical protein